MMDNSKNLTYKLVKTDRKTLSIYVERDSSVLIRAPTNISQKRLDSIVEKKKFWIYKSKTEIEELNRTRVRRRITNGEGFLFMGKSHRLKIGKNLKSPLALIRDSFYLRKIKLRTLENISSISTRNRE